MRLLWLDILKILAIFGVILLHVSAPFLVPFENSPQWWIGNIYDSLTRWCVPLFVMVSGALVLPKAENIPFQQFLLSRVRRVLIPFLVWSGIYFFYRLQVKEEVLAWFDFFPMLLVEPVYYHLWFVYMLIVLYLFAPALSAFLNEAPSKHVWYILALWLFWASILPILDRPLDLETYFTPDMDDYSALRLSGYFLLGYMLRDRQTPGRRQLFLAFFLFSTAGAGTIFGTYFLSRNRGDFDPFFYKYFSLTVVAMTISLFLLVKSLCHSRKGAVPDDGEKRPLQSPKFLQQIGMSVFGVYLAHALVLELLRDGRFGFAVDHGSAFGIAMPPAMGLPVFALSIFVVSLVLVLLLRSLPIVKEMLT